MPANTHRALTVVGMLCGLIHSILSMFLWGVIFFAQIRKQVQRAQGTVALVKGTQHAWLSAAVFIMLSLWILIMIQSGWYCFHTRLKTRRWGLGMLRPGSQLHHEWVSEPGLGPRTSDLRSRSLNHGAQCSSPDSLVETDLCKAHALSLQTPWKETLLFYPSPFS